MSVLANVLDALTVEGALYERLPEQAVRCFACGHRCLIREGKRGICQVRFNQGGELRVPWGYVAALQSDPIEKKPFFHVLPGSNALTFGMLGCDFHCGYCFTGDTVVITDRGPRTLADCFSACQDVRVQADGEIGHPSDLSAMTASGTPGRVQAVFRHPYRGSLLVIRPYHLPALQCTPDHRVYATDDPARAPQLMRAQALTDRHYLAVPRRYSFSSEQTIDTAAALTNYEAERKIHWKPSRTEIRTLRNETAQGQTSHALGTLLHNGPAHVRQIPSKARRGQIDDPYQGRLETAGNGVRFSHEPKPGVPAHIRVDEDVARLLGFYCAGGSVVTRKERPDGQTLNFSFSPRGTEHAEEARRLLQKVLHIQAGFTKRTASPGISITNSSAALMFRSLAGGQAREKHVPEPIFNAHRSIVEAFLNAVIDGDGHRYANGKISITTVSHDLAYGLAWLALKLGFLPSLSEGEFQPGPSIPGRPVQRAAHAYTVVWHRRNALQRKLVETDDFYLLPLQGIQRKEFRGQVFNMQVEGEHNYLAGFCLVSNCQNWLTSQAMRDPAADESLDQVRKITPHGMVELARRTNASAVVSSYNEPLITSEWAVGIFKEAKAAGLLCAYVSNGNNTPEVMEFIRPYIDAYKVDLKSMDDKNYRKLGGVLQHTLDGIQRAHDLGLWVEVVTLTIPGFNDSNEELWEAARFIAGVSKDIPWHVTAFHKDYKMTEPDNTPARTLLRAAEIGREAGLSFVYAGNLPGRVEEYEATFCSQCGERLIKRAGYTILEYRITAGGSCPRCGSQVPGLWPQDPSDVPLNGHGLPIPRL